MPRTDQRETRCESGATAITVLRIADILLCRMDRGIACLLVLSARLLAYFRCFTLLGKEKYQMINLQNITKIYRMGDNETEVFRDFNLFVDDGEYVAVMGRSGSGKTTLLNIIGAMDGFDSGRYMYNDSEVGKLDRHGLEQFRRNHISYVFQNYFLINYYSVRENIELPLIAKGIKRKQRREIAEQKMELAGISDIADKLPAYISGGQMQRCAIARALASGNDILLADEPTGALDAHTAEDIMNVFDCIREEKCTIIMVTHDEQIAAHADRIVNLT